MCMRTCNHGSLRAMRPSMAEQMTGPDLPGSHRAYMRGPLQVTNFGFGPTKLGWPTGTAVLTTARFIIGGAASAAAGTSACAYAAAVEMAAAGNGHGAAGVAYPPGGGYCTGAGGGA